MEGPDAPAGAATKELEFVAIDAEGQSEGDLNMLNHRGRQDDTKNGDQQTRNASLHLHGCGAGLRQTGDVVLRVPDCQGCG